MLELYKKRVGAQGNTMGEILRNQSNDIMNKTFTNDTAYKVVLIDGKKVDAKFKKHNAYSILKDYVDHYLQFRPHITYPIGTYVDIPDEAEIYQKWFIVGITEDIHFIRHLCLSCNYTLKWIIDDKIYSAVGAIRSRNSYNSGVWTSDYSTSPENEIAFWVPTTDDVKTIDYDMRFMITDNDLHPLVYTVTKREDTVPFGVTKITLGQSDLDNERDNVELRLCDYYKSKIIPVTPTVPSAGYSTITYSGVTKTLKAGGSYKTFTANFYDSNKALITLTPTWDYSSFNNTYFTVSVSDNQIRIKALPGSEGQVGTLKVMNEGYFSELSVEVIGL